MLLEVPEYAETRYTYDMVTSLLHYNDVIDRSAVHFFYLSQGLVRVSHIGKKQRKSLSGVQEIKFLVRPGSCLCTFYW